MSLPDPNIEPAEYWAELTKYPRPHMVVDFPRNKPGTNEPICKVAILVLSQGESMAANASAERVARKMLKEAAPLKGEDSRGYQELFQLAASAEVLVRSCRRVDDPGLKQPFFRAVEDIHKHLTTDEVAMLVQSYLFAKTKFGPVLAEMGSDEELDEWLRVIFEGGNYSPLFGASLGRLTQSVVYMGSRLYASPMASSSAGSSLDSPKTSTSSDPSTEDSQ